MEVLPYRENKARTWIIKQTNKCQRLLHKKIGNLACLFLEFKDKLTGFCKVIKMDLNIQMLVSNIFHGENVIHFPS